MDNLDNPVPTPLAPDTSDLQAQCDSLHQLVVSILVLLIVVSGTFTVYLLRQYRSASTDLAMAEPQVKAEMAQFSKLDNFMNDFVHQLVEYDRTHADFSPILNKYGIKPAGSAAGATPSAAPKK